MADEKNLNNQTSAEDLISKLKQLQNNSDSNGNTSNVDIFKPSNDENNADNKSASYEELKSKLDKNTSQNNAPVSTGYNQYSIYSSKQRLDKEIEEAEEFVNNTSKKKHTEQVEMPMVDNIDNYSPSKKKNGIFSIFNKNKISKNEKKQIINQKPDISIDLDSDSTYVEELEDTAELIAFEPALLSDEFKENIVENKDETVESSNSESETEIMMLALGYDAKRNREAEQKAYESLNFSDTETQGFSNTDFDVTKTSVIDKVAGEEIKNDNNISNNDKFIAVYEKLKGKRKSLKLRLIGVVLLSIMLLAFEILSQVLNWTLSPIICITIEWVLILFISIFAYDRIIKGFKQLISLKLDCDVITIISLVYTLVFTLVVLFSNSSSVRYINLPYAFCVIVSLFSELIYNRSEIYSYRVASAKKNKKAIVISDNEEIKNASSDLMTKQNYDLFEIKETNQISEFFANNSTRTSKKSLLNILIPFYVVISIVTIVILAVKGEQLYDIISTSYLMFSMTAPTITFFSYAFPLYRITRNAYSNGSAILSESSAEKYDYVGAVAFNDIDVFPAEKIKLKSINIFNSNKFEDVIYYASSVFSCVGGPLDSIFKSATLENKVSSDVEILNIAEKGIDAIVDGMRIVVGQPEYMKLQCFETIKDDEDAEIIKSTNKRVLYIACNDEVMAKFYIQYIVSKEFSRTYTYLQKAKTGIVIKTADPCLDKALLEINRFSDVDSLVRIVRMKPDLEPEDTISAKKTGIITTGSIKSLIKTMNAAQKLSGVYTLNVILKVAAAVIGAIIMLLLILNNKVDHMLSIYPILYQVVWIIIVFFASNLYKFNKK